MSKPSQRDQVFISYSHKDKKLCEKLRASLKPLIRDKKISVWDDTDIKSGDKWKEEIKKAIASAKVAVLLVSPEFLSSDFIAEHELPPLLEAAEREGVKILWVAVRHSLYAETAIARYQAVNDPLKPLASMTRANREREIVRICSEIRSAALAGQAVRPRQPSRKFVFCLTALLALAAAYGLWHRHRSAKEEALKHAKEEALKHYSDGRVFYGKRTKDGLQKAKEQFERALYKDPGCALAYVGLADYYVVAEEYFGVPSAETIPEAEKYIDKALAINESLGEAYATLGFIRAKQWRWDEAGASYQKAIDCNRYYATGRQWYSWYLRNVGAYEQSREQIEYAYELAYEDDDLLPIIHANVVIAYILKEDYPRAVEEGIRLVTRYPDFWQGYSWLGKAYQEQGNRSEALKNLNEAVKISKRSHTILANLGYAYASYGNAPEANKIIKELVGLYNNKKATGQSVAKVYNGLGDKEKAFEWLDKDAAAKSGDLPNISWHPAFKSLRGHPRFEKILKDVGLRPTPGSE